MVYLCVCGNNKNRASISAVSIFDPLALFPHDKAKGSSSSSIESVPPEGLIVG